jgi:sugar-specific transcriptional regulator TrmB
MVLEISKLEKLGFNHNEALVYKSLVDSGPATAGEIIKTTGFHRNIVYDNLEKLINDGMVTFIVNKSKRVYRVVEPEMIYEFIDKEQQIINKKKELAKSIIPTISKQLNIKKHKQEAMIYRGVNGVKWIMNDTIQEGKNYVSFGAPQASVDIMPKNFWNLYNKRLIRAGISRKMLFNKELKEYTKKNFKKESGVRLLKEGVNPLTETIVYSDKVAIIVWTSVPISVLIKDKEVASSYREWFNILWKTGTRIK